MITADLQTTDLHQMRDADIETSESNFLALVNVLLNDPIERDIFFQEVFPVEYGPKYDLALQRLICLFVSRLEDVLPVPNIDKVASMLSVAPSVMEECFQGLLYPQEVLNSLNHRESHPDAGTRASSPEQPTPDDDCIFSCLSHPPLVQVVMDSERKTSEIELESSYCEEVSVECEEVSASEVDTEGIKAEGHMGTSSCAEDRTGGLVEAADCQCESAYEDGRGLEKREFEEAQVGLPKDVATPVQERGGLLDSEEATSKHIRFIKEDGTVENADGGMTRDGPEGGENAGCGEGGAGGGVQPEAQGTTSGRCCAQTVSAHEARDGPWNGVSLQRQATVKLERIDITGKPLPPPLLRQSSRVRRKRVRLLWRKNHGPEITWVDPEDETEPTSENVHSDIITKPAKSGPAVVFACSKCSFCDHTEASLHQHLMKNHPDEFSRLLSAAIRQTSCPEPLTNQNAKASVPQKRPPKRGAASKTCPVCTKTFTRATDMRRHLKGHSDERLHCCSGCGRCFQQLHDLKRHTAVCRELIVPQPNEDPPSGPGNESESTSQSEERTEGLDSSDEVQLDNRNTPPVGEVPTSSVDQPTSVITDPRLCPVCGLVLARASDMERHMRSHSVEKPYECSQCSKTYRYPYNLKKHVDTCHGGSSIPENENAEHSSDDPQGQTAPGEVYSKVCPTCGKTFTRAADMRRHQRCHAGRLFECSECGEGFRYPFDLKRHKQNSCTEPDTQPLGVVSAKRPLICGTCGKKFSFLTHFERHMRAHRQANKPTKRWHKCAKCEEIFRTLYDLGKHQRCHWGDDPLRCTQCGRRFSHSSQLASHKQVHSLVFTMKCTMCEATFTELAGFRLHYLQAHNIRGAYPCAHCEKSFTELCPLIRHLRTHTGERPYQCTQCSKSFSTPSKLSMHKRAHSAGEKAPRERRHLCHECGKCFYTSAELTRHEVVHCEERPHMCAHCGKAFKRLRSLTAHMESHMESHVRMRYPCSYCGKTFVKAGALVRHHRIHTGERPHRCTECNKSFLTRSEVLKHMRFHTGERPFKCEVCSKTFTQSCYLTAHMRTHTGERPYACKMCDKRFSDSAHRKRHMLIHTGEKPHVCERCGRAFNRKNLLNVHLKTCT